MRGRPTITPDLRCVTGIEPSSSGTGASALQGKSIHWSVRFQTYSQRTVERDFSYSTAQRTSDTLPLQKSFTSASVAPVSATSSAISTRASCRSTKSGTGGSSIGMSSRSSMPV